jgi:hypothetical protein
MIVSFTFIIVVDYSMYYTIYKYFWPVATHGHDPSNVNICGLRTLLYTTTIRGAAYTIVIFMCSLYFFLLHPNHNYMFIRTALTHGLLHMTQ